MKQSTILFAIVMFLAGCNSKTAESYLDEAEQLSDNGKYQDAILLLDEAITRDDKYLGAYINRRWSKMR